MGVPLSRCLRAKSPAGADEQLADVTQPAEHRGALAERAALSRADARGGPVGYAGERNTAGQKHGEGSFRWTAGEAYEGEFRSDKLHGRGVQRYANGDAYEGQWAASQRHGVGTYRFANGAEYEGQWRADEMHGEGILRFQDGGSYEGEFREGEYHGSGALRFWWHGRLHYTGRLSSHPSSADPSGSHSARSPWLAQPQPRASLPLLAPCALERPKSRFGAIVPPSLVDFTPQTVRLIEVASAAATPQAESGSRAHADCVRELSFHTNFSRASRSAASAGKPPGDGRGDGPADALYSPPSPAALFHTRVDEVVMKSRLGEGARASCERA